MSQKNQSTSSDLAPTLIVYGLLKRQRKGRPGSPASTLRWPRKRLGSCS